MYQKKVKIYAENGIHTRPAAMLVTEAKKFTSDITINSKGKIANLKSLFKMQSLDLSKNTTIEIVAEGEDEYKAVNYLIKFILKMD
ncbi:MAG: HPr family phosphocarrier protein [Candidatus Makana argininalis]